MKTLENNNLLIPRNIRTKLIKRLKICPITLISDVSLLVITPIKPLQHCKDVEIIDCKNYFVFSPHINFLFNKGFISFANNKTLIISPCISESSRISFNIIDGKYYDTLPIKGREIFLEYHREFIFKSLH